MKQDVGGVVEDREEDSGDGGVDGQDDMKDAYSGEGRASRTKSRGTQAGLLLGPLIRPLKPHSRVQRRPRGYLI